MDVFVLPSIYEGFGLVNIEAQVSGLACVVSQAIPREADISGKVDFLPFDVSQWCKMLEKNRVNNHFSNRQSLYTKEYDIHSEVLRLESFYNNICL